MWVYFEIRQLGTCDISLTVGGVLNIFARKLGTRKVLSSLHLRAAPPPLLGTLSIFGIKIFVHHKPYVIRTQYTPCHSTLDLKLLMHNPNLHTRTPNYNPVESNMQFYMLEQLSKVCITCLVKMQQCQFSSMVQNRDTIRRPCIKDKTM